MKRNRFRPFFHVINTGEKDVLAFTLRIAVGDAETEFLHGTFIALIAVITCQQANITGTARVVHSHAIETDGKSSVIHFLYGAADAGYLGRS